MDIVQNYNVGRKTQAVHSNMGYVHLSSMGTFIGQKSTQKGKVQINFTTGAATGEERRRLGKGTQRTLTICKAFFEENRKQLWQHLNMY